MTWSIGSNKKISAFTFIELMVTVIVVTVGLVMIIQGFITAANALNSMQNHLQAIQFLDAKMQELEIAARHDNGVKEDEEAGKFSSGAREFEWKLTIAAVEGPQGEDKEKEQDLSEDLNEARLQVFWSERKIQKDLSLVTYLKNKKI